MGKHLESDLRCPVAAPVRECGFADPVAGAAEAEEVPLRGFLGSRLVADQYPQLVELDFGDQSESSQTRDWLGIDSLQQQVSPDLVGVDCLTEQIP